MAFPGRGSGGRASPLVFIAFTTGVGCGFSKAPADLPGDPSGIDDAGLRDVRSPQVDASGQPGDAGGKPVDASGGVPGLDGAADVAGAAPDAGEDGSSLARCGPLALSASVMVAGKSSDQFIWNDASCQPRAAALVRAGAGYLRQFTYQVDGNARECTGTGAAGWEGWGYTVTHYGDTSSSGQDATGGTSTLVFQGRHHAIYQYQYAQPIAGKAIPVTIHWMFATGRDNPVYALTYDVSQVQPGSLVADTRAPYGDIYWDGAKADGTVISGVGWGDRYKFVTTRAPLTMNSDWDYTKPNQVPYVFAWATSPDAEMGAVQTQTYQQHDGGGYWHYPNWGKTSKNQAKENGQVGLMPVTWDWTYQLGQYELCIDDPSCVDKTTSSHRLAWGANYGAVGGATAGSDLYAAYGDDRQVSGHPYQSYAVFMVLGKHSDARVFAQVAEVETVQSTVLAATKGSVDTDGPGGVGRTDSVKLAPPGYDHRYGVWNVTAANDAVQLSVTVPAGKLASPVLVVSGYAKSTSPTISVGGRVGAPDVDYFLSSDPATKKLWITFPGGWSGTESLSVE